MITKEPAFVRRDTARLRGLILQGRPAGTSVGWGGFIIWPDRVR